MQLLLAAWSLRMHLVHWADGEPDQLEAMMRACGIGFERIDTASLQLSPSASAEGASEHRRRTSSHTGSSKKRKHSSQKKKHRKSRGSRDFGDELSADALELLPLSVSWSVTTSERSDRPVTCGVPEVVEVLQKTALATWLRFVAVSQA